MHHAVLDAQQLNGALLQAVENQIPRELLEKECPNPEERKIMAQTPNLWKPGDQRDGLGQGFLPSPGNVLTPFREQVIRAVGNIQEKNGPLCSANS